jgi:hypothetical protein
VLLISLAIVRSTILLRLQVTLTKGRINCAVPSNVTSKLRLDFFRHISKLLVRNEVGLFLNLNFGECTLDLDETLAVLLDELHFFELQDLVIVCLLVYLFLLVGVGLLEGGDFFL